MKALSRNLLAGALLAALPMGGALACTTSAWTNTATTTAVAGSPGAVARYAGECGLQPAGATPWVLDNSPTNETDYRARFYVFTGTATGSPVIFQATDTDGGTGAVVAQVTYDAANGQFDFSSGAASGSANGIQANKWYSVEIYFDSGNALSATVGGGNTNALTNVSITGTAAAGTVNSAKLGAVSGGSATTTMRFDEFESTRSTTTGIGRLCRGDADASGQVQIPDVVLALVEFLPPKPLNSGQPDCDENGVVDLSDATCIALLALPPTGGVCANIN